MERVGSFALALALVLCAPVSQHARAAQETSAKKGERESLQEFLERLRRLQQGLLSGLKANVEQALRALETEAKTRRIEGLEEARLRLVALGAESAPLLVDRIDPGAAADDTQKLVAQYVTAALVELPTRATTQRLAEIARSGSPDGRLNAVRLLAVAPDREEATRVLTFLYRKGEGKLRAAALSALAKLGGAENETLLKDALADRDPDTVKLALGALANAHSIALAPSVLRLLEVPREAGTYVEGFLSYYRACPEALDKAHMAALVRVAQEFAVPTESRVRILEVVPTFADRVDNDVRKTLRAISDSPSREIREAALVALVLLADKAARKDLLSDYDAQIERNKGWANSYEARANVLYRIGEYKDAIKDYTKSLQLSADDARARQDTAFIGLARCYMQLGKLKEAAQSLEKATISMKDLAALAQEPLFAKLAKDPKYRHVFRAE